ncbi:MAG: DUF2842 domain-containing protein [Methyloligella sp. ZOD6]
MSRPARKFIGTIVLVVFVMAYVLVAAAIGSGRILEAPMPIKFGYFLVAGLLWVLPAGLLIRWMQKPDSDAPQD